MHRKLSIVFIFLQLTFIGMYAQETKEKQKSDTTRKKSDVYFGKKPLRNFYINGQFETCVYYRDVNDLFDGTGKENKTFGFDDGGQKPQLELDLSGRPTSKTYFKTELTLYTPYMGMTYNTNKVAMLIGVNLEGQINTKVGDLSFKLGGNQYTKLSKLTLWTNENNGESLWELNPWQYFQNAAQNYESYYSQGTIIRDFRWGNQIVQGLTASLDNIPGNLEARLVVLKTTNNGGQTSYLNTIPDWSYGGKIGKRFGNNYVGLNTFNSVTETDSINGENIGFGVYTLNYNLNLLDSDITASGELGLGNNKQEINDTLVSDWGKAIEFSLLTRKRLVGIPLTLHTYYIESSFVNLSGGFNTFMVNSSAGFNGQQTGSTPHGAFMSDIDYMNSNRTGLDLRTEINLAGIKINLASGFSREIEQAATSVSYNHQINGVTFSRLYSYQNNLGPDSTLYSSFRSYYENRSIDTANADYKGEPLYFAVTEWNLKYKFNLFNKPLYMFYLGSINSIQQDFAAVPRVSDKALFTIQCHEFEAYYKIFNKMALTSYFGLESIEGNKMTQLSKSQGLPADQIGKAIGLGFDYVLADLVNLNFRARWFDYEDKNSDQVHYNGFETTLQLRIYF